MHSFLFKDNLPRSALCSWLKQINGICRKMLIKSHRILLVFKNCWLSKSRLVLEQYHCQELGFKLLIDIKAPLDYILSLLTCIILPLGDLRHWPKTLGVTGTSYSGWYISGELWSHNTLKFTLRDSVWKKSNHKVSYQCTLCHLTYPHNTLRT